jgi:uncharacterized RDD family membrane protein YckC
MSTPPSGSANGSTPVGYYPDPSIPGYVRYWDGSGWLPGTSRPGPRRNEPVPEPPPVTTQQETGPVFLDEEPADESVDKAVDEPRPSAGGALPEPRPRGEAGVPPGEPVTDWDAPGRPHENRPEPATAWQADASRQTGFGGEPDNKVAWGADEDHGVSPVLGEGRTPRAIGRGRADPRGGRQRPVGTREAGGGGEGKSERQGVRGPEEQREERGGKESAQPVREENTRPRRAGIQAARQSARPSPPPPAPSQAPSASAAPAPVGWAQQVRELARQVPAQHAQQSVPVQAPGPASTAAAASAPGAGSVTPWRLPAGDPFLRAAQARPAGLGRRFVARLLDGIVVAAVGGAVALPLLPKAVDHIQAKVDAVEQAGVTQDIWLVDATTGGYLAMVLGAVLTFGVLYEALPTARWGCTLGKKLCGLRVLDMEQQLSPGFGTALLRWLVHGALSAVVVGVLNVTWCLFDRPWHQCWHDKAARTFVARHPARVSSRGPGRRPGGTSEHPRRRRGW